jgi:hypothetical protein
MGLRAERIAATSFVLQIGAAGTGLIGARREGLAVGLGFGERLFQIGEFLIDPGERLRQADEVTVEAEPHLLVEGFVALELAVGLGLAECFIGGDFGEALRGKRVLHGGLEPAHASQVAFGVVEFRG